MRNAITHSIASNVLDETILTEHKPSPEKRVLLVAPYFLPRRRVGSMRPFRFAIHLPDFGWETSVMSIAAPSQELTAKETELLQRVRLLPITPPLDRTNKSESQLGSTAKQRRSSSKGPVSRLLASLDRQFPVDTWLMMFLTQYRTLIRTAEEVAPHVIWATGDPWSGLVVGKWLSDHLDVPFVADFRDPWTLSEVRTAGQWSATRAIDRAVERRIVRSADTIMFQAQRVADAYASHYEHLKPIVSVIRNSFDPAVFDDPIRIEGPAPTPTGPTLDIGFFGRFRAMSPAALMIDILATMRSKHPQKTERVRVHSFGALSDADASRARAHRVEHQFVAHDAVPLQRALRALRRFDILLVSTETRRERIIPAKLFEYLPAGRPILSLSRNPEVADILDRTRTGVQVQEMDEAADLLTLCVDALDQGRPLPIPFNPHPAEIMKHEAATTTGNLAAVLDGLTFQRTGTSDEMS